jgi:hypothetical protein
MNMQPAAHQRLGEREFLDYPVFLEVGAAERGELLRRALLAALGVGAIVALVIALA